MSQESSPRQCKPEGKQMANAQSEGGSLCPNVMITSFTACQFNRKLLNSEWCLSNAQMERRKLSVHDYKP